MLLDDGESCARIAKVLCLDDDTIRSWPYKYHNESGGGSLMMVGKGGQSRMMAPQQAALRDWLGAHFAVQPSKLGPISPPN